MSARGDSRERGDNDRNDRNGDNDRKPKGYQGDLTKEQLDVTLFIAQLAAEAREEDVQRAFEDNGFTT